MNSKKKLSFAFIDSDKEGETPLYLSRVAAGFPSPAEDFIEKTIDLNKELIKHKAATFFVRVEGDSMIDAQIHAGDVLIIDRALEPKSKDIILAVINGEFTVKTVLIKEKKLYLLPQNSRYSPIEIHDDWDFAIWGVVTYIIYKARK